MRIKTKLHQARTQGKKITVTLPSELERSVASLAKSEGRSVAGTVRRIVQLYFRKE